MTAGLLTWLVVHFTFNVVVTDSSWRTIHLAFLCQKQHTFADIWGGAVNTSLRVQAKVTTLFSPLQESLVGGQIQYLVWSHET